MIVRYLINKSGITVEKIIHSYYVAKKFVNKLEHSKKCTLLSYEVL